MAREPLDTSWFENFDDTAVGQLDADSTCFGFLREVVDSVTDHIAVIDRVGNICFTNRAWVVFAEHNDCAVTEQWHGINYLAACDTAAAAGDEFAAKAASGIRQVIGGAGHYYLEYPCHSPDEQRWFMMRVTTFDFHGTPYFVVSHQNITERKLAEEKMRALSRIDGLTGLPNRRRFDEFFREEWRRCRRLRQPVSLAMIDIDHFKRVNDTYGHQHGDDCLVSVGKAVAQFAHRPTDLCARYGGEEFALVFGNSRAEQLLGLIDELMGAVRRLRLSQGAPSSGPCITVSVGLATMYPDRQTGENELLTVADRHLLAAKTGGRDRLVWDGSAAPT